MPQELGMTQKNLVLAVETITHWQKILMTSWMTGHKELTRMLAVEMNKVIDSILTDGEKELIHERIIKENNLGS